jgi:hypothetical protein
MVMAGLDPTIHAFGALNGRGTKKEVLDTLTLAPVELKSDSSLTRRGVDGRVKPGHDDKRFPTTSQMTLAAVSRT